MTRLMIIAGLLSYYATLDDEQKERFSQLAKMGFVSTAVSIPIGVWALEKWPDEPWKTLLITTGTGLALRSLMLTDRDDEQNIKK